MRSSSLRTPRPQAARLFLPGAGPRRSPNRPARGGRGPEERESRRLPSPTPGPGSLRTVPRPLPWYLQRRCGRPRVPLAVHSSREAEPRPWPRFHAPFLSFSCLKPFPGVSGLPHLVTLHHGLCGSRSAAPATQLQEEAHRALRSPGGPSGRPPPPTASPRPQPGPLPPRPPLQGASSPDRVTGGLASKKDSSSLRPESGKRGGGRQRRSREWLFLRDG
ncbi:WAS/WASL-interacting protein family member 1-like [Manis pentadactyla]|uniref:WAS/WASL-interacting protein family member 1-like n=1 Tax=Manis pentadactyla TaxID=143292 RepID=UPI00255CE1F4|nr:WAS/WASL-interacting protein family member 1-like [Manis pentadactyla]XP_057348897.1 WAS/WASL-interacting protein family member 1-like [Manis pentadactyla]XP_057348898.1 WAS/WASL-interacting protein family member 1-like [Manis pentadactyla]XP_057348899.1 WAS/WASL-interacting protein family member 1-like [Manis pentadactyla]XP_057348900.1 WAS/WASL-interacting protein family member 1-like [Manis pentadactyla]XP_057348901.1 WAS/WASL-interacting protein family member 1-like [Manis pentadactyla]